MIPIGVPVIAGPGAITTAIIYRYQRNTLLTDIYYVTLLIGASIRRVTGELPLNLIARVSGLILIAISVQLMVGGVTQVVAGWTR